MVVVFHHGIRVVATRVVGACVVVVVVFHHGTLVVLSVVNTLLAVVVVGAFVVVVVDVTLTLKPLTVHCLGVVKGRGVVVVSMIIPPLRQIGPRFMIGDSGAAVVVEGVVVVVV